MHISLDIFALNTVFEGILDTFDGDLEKMDKAKLEAYGLHATSKELHTLKDLIACEVEEWREV